MTSWMEQQLLAEGMTSKNKGERKVRWKSELQRMPEVFTMKRFVEFIGYSIQDTFVFADRHS